MTCSELIQLAEQVLRRFVGCVNHDVADELLEEIDSLGVEGIVVGFWAGARHGVRGVEDEGEKQGE